MKIFANRSIWKKIVIIFSLIISMSFVEPAPVNAGIGGTLMEPICDLLVGLGDGFMNVTHNILVGQETTLIRVNLNTTEQDVLRIAFTAFVFIAVLAAAAVITGVGALAVGAITGALTSGAAAAAGVSVGALAKGIITTALVSNIVPILVSGAYFGVKAYSRDQFDDEAALPLYSISPERIFSNTVPIFDVNFFNPNSAPFKYEWIHKTTTEEFAQLTRNGYDSNTGLTKYTDLTEEDKKLTLDFSSGTDVTEQLKKDLHILSLRNGKQIELNGTKYIQYEYKEQEQSTDWIKMTKRVNEGNSSSTKSSTETDDGTAKGEGEKHTISYELAKTVKFWYSIIRTFAIVGMMSVLVYIGIRILLSSTSEKQAKYKQLLGDWVVGMVLLFTMQYIMVFANIAVDHLTDLLKNINPNGQTALIQDNDDKIETELKKYNINTTPNPGGELSENNMTVYKYTDEKGDKYIEWNTDLMERLRIDLQLNRDKGEAFIGYTIMYVVMIIYTGIFFYTYAKRVIYMAFLTVISPLVALTYPIDKVNDGSAQGFNYWFKEYIFNLLLQPLHLLIYTILVSTAIKFATENVIYSLVALGFITQAEKIVRQMFNFSKASTPGVFAGPAGAAIAMTGMRWLMGRGPNGSSGGGSSKGNGGASNEYSGITSAGNKTKVMDTESLGGILGDDNINDSIGSDISGGVPASRTSIVLNGGNDGTENTGEGANASVTSSIGENPEIGDLDSSSIRFANPDSYDVSSGDGSEGLGDVGDVGDVGNVGDFGNFEGVGEFRERPLTRMSADEYIQSRNDEGRRLRDEIIRRNEEERNRKLSKMSPREYIESKEDAEAIAIRRYKEKQRERGHNRHTFRGVPADSADAYKDGIKRKLKSNLENGKPGKFVRKTLGGAIGAATFGTLGIAAGVASGDMKSVMTDGVAGVAGGYKLGSGTITAASNALNVEGVGDTFERSSLGEDRYKKLMAYRNQMKKAREEETINKIQLKQKVSRAEAKRLSEEYAQFYMEQGINDVDDWILLEKMTKQKVVGKGGRKLNRNYTRKEAVGAYKALNRSVGSRDRIDALKKIESDYNVNSEQADTIYRTAKVLDNLKEGEI